MQNMTASQIARLMTKTQARRAYAALIRELIACGYMTREEIPALNAHTTHGGRDWAETLAAGFEALESAHTDTTRQVSQETWDAGGFLSGHTVSSLRSSFAPALRRCLAAAGVALGAAA